ncbi:enoyl-CoA hydratase-related protein [Nocardioides sp. NPDC006273]|uniref:enoyl-CoA hydratase-related protein n=1 Tax=Nocardioides sp. NPDC006273 TaxID=3155598 RepID=UPI0033A553F5
MRATTAEGVLTVALDRPERLNALTAGEMEAVRDAIAAAGDDVRVIVLSGDGNAFCSGADLESADELSGEEAAAPTIDAANDLVATITNSPKPVITLAGGAVAGVGVPIALASDLVLCDESAYFMLAFTRVGLMPDGGASALVAASIGRARAMRMALLAQKLPASDAAAAGLVADVWPSNEFDDRAADVIERLRTGPRAALRQTKHAINSATLHRLDLAFALERAGQIGLLGAADFAEGSTAFREKRKAQFTDQ